MIHHFVQFALRQRFLVLMLVFLVVVAGALSFQRMPVDAYPDLSPPMVEIITQWPGHAAEEIERLVTLPIEVEMNGVPHMAVMRSISLYGLSDVIMTFQESTDDYFARHVVFERLSDVQLPSGVTPSLSPLSSPSGLVYRYVLESPDRSPQQLKTIEDWVVERAYKSVPGVADDSGFGGTVMQYQVLLDPAKIYNYHIPMPQVLTALAANNANAGGGFYSQGSQFFYVRGLGLVTKTEDIGNIVVGSNNGVPVRIRDVGEVTIGNAPRLGEFGFQKNDDSVEGVILMLRGEQTQNVLKGVEKKTEELNNGILPSDVKMHPFYDRSDLVRLTIDTVEHNMLVGMTLVLIVLIFFLVSFRAAIIVALTIPLSLLFAFILVARARRARQPALHRRDRLRDHHRRHRGDDGKHLPRTGRPRGAGLQTARSHRGGGARRGPADFLFRRRHSRRIPSHLRPHRPFGETVPSDGGDDVLRPAGIAHLHPHACARARLVLVQERRKRNREPAVRMGEGSLRGRARLVPGPSENDHDCRDDYFRRHASLDSLYRRRIHAAPGRRRAVGARHDAVHDFLRGSGQVRAANSQHPDVLSAGDRSRIGIGAP